MAEKTAEERKKEVDDAVSTLDKLLKEGGQETPGQFQFLDKWNQFIRSLKGEEEEEETPEEQSQADILFQPPVA